MVSYYSPVAMFSRTGTAHPHHHPHHSTPPQNPYFSNPYNTSAYHHHYQHTHHHQSGPSGGPGVTTTQFSPPLPTDCNHPYQHQLGNMTPETMAAAAAVGWHQPNVNVMYSACASARNMVSGGYEEWTHAHPYPPPHHASLYHHQQPSPPNSTPSPNSTHNGGHLSPNGYPIQPVIFKTEFNPCSGGNPQENSSQEMQSQGSGSLVTSAAAALVPVPTSHSPDSGMAISDGVSSSGSPATTGSGHALGHPHAHCLNSHHHHLSTAMLPNNPMLPSQPGNLNQLSHNHHHPSNGGSGHMSLNNTATPRPAQARSPYEWMKKPTYTTITAHPGGGKTRTKDKYRVVYTDTQRVELEKEFHYSKYITIRRKSELAEILGLSERQVKIWFQNRRAKDRKTNKKQEEMFQREKIATMVHMQNSAILSGNMHPGNGMCNQGNSLPHM